jgi:hypothetical protein
MAKSRQSRETAKALVSPLFAWTNAVLKGGELMLDSMQAATRNADRTVRVAVLPDADRPKRRTAPGKPKSRSTRAKSRRRR